MNVLLPTLLLGTLLAVNPVEPRRWEIRTSTGWRILGDVPDHVLAGLERNEIGIYERSFEAEHGEPGPRRYRLNPHSMLQTNISPWMTPAQQARWTRQIRPEVVATESDASAWDIETRSGGWVDSNMPPAVRQALDRREFAVYSRMVEGFEYWYKVDGDLMRQYNITPQLTPEVRESFTRNIRPRHSGYVAQTQRVSFVFHDFDGKESTISPNGNWTCPDCRHECTAREDECMACEYWRGHETNPLNRANVNAILAAQTDQPQSTKTAADYTLYAADGTCVICLDVVGTNGHVMAAGHGGTAHAFCHRCLADYLSHKGDRAPCPVCRQWIEHTYRLEAPQPSDSQSSAGYPVEATQSGE